ncbi:MAG: SGNH/GDSL hydrolase family protein [Kiritimatiellae bacterium]|nr:SGNH/GDSL hydrolase family protein [Kiritimatiellia bacterium]
MTSSPRVHKFAVFAAALLAALFSAAKVPEFKNGDTVVFFGDSITHGGFYHKYLADFYRTRYPDRRIRFINSGIGGDTAAGALSRVDVDVREWNPACVFIHFGMNDVDRGAYGPGVDRSLLRRRMSAQRNYGANMLKLVAAVRNAVPGAKLVFLTTTPYEDAAEVELPKGASGWAVKNNVGCNIGLSLMSGFVLDEAERQGVASVDWFSELNAFRERHLKTDPKFRFTRWDRVHPTEIGHSVMAWQILREQGVSPVVSVTELDATGRVGRCENAKVTDVAAGGDEISFTLLAGALPLPVADEALAFTGEFKVEETLNRETLRVTGLAAAASWTLSIDGDDVGVYTSAQLGRGVQLGFNPKTPQFRQARKIAEQAEKLRVEEVIVRNHHSARWFFRGKTDVDDIPGFRNWYETVFLKNPQKWSDYFGGMIPGYLDYWPKRVEVQADLRRRQDALLPLAKPVPRRYRLRRVGG